VVTRQHVGDLHEELCGLAVGLEELREFPEALPKLFTRDEARRIARRAASPPELQRALSTWAPQLRRLASVDRGGNRQTERQLTLTHPHKN